MSDIELMRCQLCGGEAEFMEEGDVLIDEFDRVGCYGCGTMGPWLEWNQHQTWNHSGSGITKREHVLSEQARCRPIVATKWNRMQALIARGLLMEQEADAAPKKSKRL